MATELKKRKYGKKEVEKLLEVEMSNAESKLAEQKLRIFELVEENKKIMAELTALKEKEQIIDSAFIKAEQYAEYIKRKESEQYALTVAKLKAFCERWSQYFDELKEKYPLYPYVQQSIALVERLRKAFNENDGAQTVDILDKELCKNQGKTVGFDPKQKIQDYVAATSTNGFNLEEVLNPGKLELEDLCKELGLIEEE